jgi:hypothetical protein
MPGAMTTRTRLLLCAAALAVPGWVALHAADPKPAAGKVLLLDNERVLEGDIELVGARYRVRRANGETWVQADQAMCLCASLDDACAHLRSRANLSDPDERLRLARWCHLRGLHAQAVAEVKAAAELRPGDGATQRLLNSLEQAAVAPAPAPGPQEAAPEPSVPVPDLSADSLCTFRTRVQPILMNACASCHATGRGGPFKLLRVYEDGGTGRKTVERNLVAVLAEINLRAPAGSPLLTKAVSAHDGNMAEAPLRGRQAAAYRVLEEWVQRTVADNPQLHGEETAVAPAPPEPKAVAHVQAESAPAPQAKPSESASAVEARPVPHVPAEPAAASVTPPAKSAEPSPAPPRNPADGPVDPFDPLPFNRQMHPDRTVDER